MPLPLHKQMERKGLMQSMHNDGDSRLDAMQKDLDRFVFQGNPLRRSRTQQDWHRVMLIALMRNIYDRYFHASSRRIFIKFHITEIRQEVLISTGRGHGKTIAVAMILAVIAMHCVNKKICLFASGLRLAMEMLEKTRALIEDHPSGQGRVIARHSSAQKLRVRGPRNHNGNGKNVNQLWALPGKSETVRGLHPDVIVVDEFTFTNSDVFMKAILPMTQREGVTLIGISTPQGRNNIFSRLQTMMDDSIPPRPMYRVITSGRICEDCRRKKQPDKCTHMDAHIPEWFDVHQMTRAKQILQSSLGSSALYVNEALGEMADIEPGAFELEDIDALINNVPHGMALSTSSTVTCIYLACDTNGPGKNEMAFVGYAEKAGRLEICMLASTPGTTEGVDGDRRFTRRVFETLRQMYPSTVIVFIPEANYAKEASHLWDHIRHMPLVVTMQEVGEGYYGVRKDNFITFEMHSLYVRMLREKAIFIAPEFVGIPPDKKAANLGLDRNPEAAASYMLSAFKQQLMAMRYQRVNTREGSKEEYTIHGKGMGMNDDLAVAAMMGPYWRQVFLRSCNSNYVVAKSKFPAF